ncbi:hypothetical protein D5086_029020 [Populus alba]|uniref:Uncharacterized protein n=1 Tax=Populus alba TaxID=43335 RepID=A0ACC4ASG9_POPAL
MVEEDKVKKQKLLGVAAFAVQSGSSIEVPSIAECCFCEKAMLQETMFAMDMSVCVDYEMAWVADYWRCFNNGKERDIFSILGLHDRSLPTHFKTTEFRF